AVPCLAVPTTAGAGAEVTANAVLAVPEHRVKVSMRSPLMIPRVAVVDPVLTVGCPAGVTAASGLDALTQCLEPFVSARANPITDALAREGLRHAASGLRRAHADGSDLEARTDMAVCGLLGGMALANAKLGAVHGFAGVLGGITSAAHGALCAALLAPVVDANVRALRGRHPEHRALARYGEAAGVLTGNPNATVEDGISWIRETVAMLGIPTLRTFGLGEEHADEVIGKAARASSMRGNPVELSPDELGVVFASALCGAAR
ncbi:MAG: iron-containing alcohol dehydrogenase, partial [Dactylosporangium sp.]|nr:iron-containing alcohol dehydrogenase [Dactylosporangium sp.]NNJ60918.1 iron-containing alcohol dehydrogenase [Dactylosporangium sp.]